MNRPIHPFWAEIYDLQPGQTKTVDMPPPESLASWRSYISQRFNASSNARRWSVKCDHKLGKVTFECFGTSFAEVFSETGRQTLKKVAGNEELTREECAGLLREIRVLEARLGALTNAVIIRGGTVKEGDDFSVWGEVIPSTSKPSVELHGSVLKMAERTMVDDDSPFDYGGDPDPDGEASLPAAYDPRADRTSTQYDPRYDPNSDEYDYTLD